MYNNAYEEYIRNMLGGYPESSRQDLYSYGDNIYETNFDFENNDYSNMNIDLEKYYPEIYRLLYPMIQKACMKNSRPISKQLIDEMVEDIYSNFVSTEMTTINVNLGNDVRSNNSQAKQENSKTSKTSAIVSVSSRSAQNRETEKIEVENRQLMANNSILNDLIRILLLRELLGKSGRCPTFKPPLEGFPNRPHNRPPKTFNMNNYFSNMDEGYNIFDY